MNLLQRLARKGLSRPEHLPLNNSKKNSVERHTTWCKQYFIIRPSVKLYKHATKSTYLILNDEKLISSQCSVMLILFFPEKRARH